MLEEGKVEESDRKKDDLEEFQRERRKELSKRGEEHVPRFFKWVHFFYNPIVLQLLHFDVWSPCI